MAGGREMFCCLCPWRRENCDYAYLVKPRYIFSFCFALDFVIPVVELLSDSVPKFYTTFSLFGFKRPVSSSEKTQKSDMVGIGLDFGNRKH
jgi:hypothetical protein